MAIARVRRDFPRLDSPTEQNLRVLEGLADQDGRPGDFELIHAMVVAAIQNMEMLPAEVAHHFEQGAFMIGASLDGVSAQRRMESGNG